MLAFRKWFCKPKKTDSHLLAQFFYADEELNTVSRELDSFDGRQDPDRCTVLVNQLRMCQDRVLGIIEQLMSEAIPDNRASRDFRAKFPDDVLQDSLAGQLWFGAECLAAGSTIMNREIESAALRPLAKCLTRNLDALRTILRDQSYKNLTSCPQKVKEALKKFDHVFSEFELSYVSAMVPVKSALEYNIMQDVIVLFCQTIERALSKTLLTQDEIDDYDPGLMFTIPRLAIVSGLVVFPDGPLNMARPPGEISELFRPFQNLLIKIKYLLETLTKEELHLLERALCSSEESWEDIEHELDQLGCHERPCTSMNSRLHDEAGCRLSPCSSCITDCETVCSSVLSMTPDDGSVRRKVSETGNQASVSGADHLDIPGAGNYDGMEAEEARGIRIKRCMRTSQGFLSPQISPDSLDGSPGSSRECLRGRRRSSSRPSNAGLEDSGQFQDMHLLSRSVDSSPRLAKRTLQVCPAPRERAASQNASLSPAEILQEGGRVLRREDSGLGSAPDGNLMELYIQEAQSTFVPLDNDPDDFDDSVVPFGIPSGQGSSANSQENLGLLTEEGSKTVIMEVEGSELIVASQDSKPCKCAKRNNPSRITMDFGSNFPIFGKGSPSTELNTTRTVGVHEHHGSSHARRPHVVSRHSDSSIRVEPSSEANGTGTRTHITVRPSQSDPTLRIPFLGSSNIPASHFHAGDNMPSALNLVTGSTGMVRHLSDSDEDDSSDMSSVSSFLCCSSCCSSESGQRGFKWESDDSSETNSMLSESNDEQEITMAIQAARLADRQHFRSQFRSSSDLVHRLFKCIAGVADQLQTNFASDLRSILKVVFEMNTCNPTATEDSVYNSSTAAAAVAAPSTTTGAAATTQSNGTQQDSASTMGHAAAPAVAPSTSGSINSSSSSSSSSHRNGQVQATEGSRHGGGSESRERRRHCSNSSHRSRKSNYDDPPDWVPDETRDECLSCHSSFTMLRRKHHCRNCGQIFCARCSANSVPLPRFGQMKAVRVCNRCYVFHVTPFQH